MMPSPHSAGRLHWACLVFALAMTGCNSRPIVTGMVLYQNNALTTGEVSLIGADGKSRSGLIGTDGRYEIADAPLGDVKIVVVATRAENAGKTSGSLLAGSKNDKAPTVRSIIPARYGDPATSQLQYVVIAGRQTKDIELTE